MVGMLDLTRVARPVFSTPQKWLEQQADPELGAEMFPRRPENFSFLSKLQLSVVVDYSDYDVFEQDGRPLDRLGLALPRTSSGIRRLNT